MTDETRVPESFTSEPPLQGWKEIAAYLDRDQRTARRWESDEGLPVRRHRTDRRSSVYAYPGEIDAWRSNRPPQGATETEIRPTVKRRLWVPAAALAAAAALWLVFSAPWKPLIQADAAGVGVRTAEICQGCDGDGSISPDGQLFAYTDWDQDGALALRQVDGDGIRHLTNGPDGDAEYPVFSPDGKRVAFVWVIGTGEEIRQEMKVIDSLDDPRPRTVYVNPDLKLLITRGWTKNNQLVVWFRSGDWSTGIGLISLENGSLTVLKSTQPNEQIGHIALSHQDGWLAYDISSSPEDPRRDVFLIALDGSSERRVTRDEANDFVMGFTPDDRGLLLSSDRTGSYSLWLTDLGIDNAEPQLLLRDSGFVEPIDVTDDGALIYSRVVGGVDLYRAQVDFNNGKLLRRIERIPTKLQGSNEGPWLSPDGKQIAYFASPVFPVGGQSFRKKAVLIHDLETGEEFRVDGRGINLMPYYGVAWAPDGRRILVSASDAQGRWSLAELDLKKNTASFLLSDFEVLPWAIGYLGDSRTAVFSTVRNAAGVSEDAIWTVEKGEQPRRIYAAESSIRWAELSPNRDSVAVRQAEPPVLKVVPLGGGTPREVAEVPCRRLIDCSDPTWTADGKSLLISVLDGDENRRLWVVPLDDSPIRHAELAPRNMKNLSAGKDGKTIFFQSGENDIRIFRTENYLERGRFEGE